MASLSTEDKQGLGVLVSTKRVEEMLGDPTVRLVACHNDLFAYTAKHIPGSIGLDCGRDLGDPIVRDLVDVKDFEAWARRSGITRDTQLVLYGEGDPRWACYAFWVLHLFGHTRAVVMDGGREKWTREGRPIEAQTSSFAETRYHAPRRDDRSFRAFREDVMLHVVDKGLIIDAREKQEHAGDTDESSRRSDVRPGHIPGSINLPWNEFLTSDGCFKPELEIRQVVSGRIEPSVADDAIVYSRLGERSSVVWFVLKHVLEWPSVRNYDGGWAEWGNAIGLPIAR